MNVRVARVRDARFEITARNVSTVVDLPAEQGGLDGFRPVELLLGSLGACMLGTMLSFAKNQRIPVEGVSLELEAVVEEHPERVARIEMAMQIEGAVSERQVQSLQRVAQGCKIHNTLHQGAETALSVQVVAAERSDRR